MPGTTCKEGSGCGTGSKCHSLEKPPRTAGMAEDFAEGGEGFNGWVRAVVGRTGAKVHRWEFSGSEAIRLVYSILIFSVCPLTIPVSRPALNICRSWGKSTNKKLQTTFLNI